MVMLSKTRQDALNKAQDFFRKANLHPSSQAFRIKCIEDYGFYDGMNNSQWTTEDLNTLKSRNQLPITVNLCKAFIDNLSGVEIQSRYRTAVRNDSGQIEEDKVAEALTHLLFFIQENQNCPYKGSLKFRDSLICGIGWGHLFNENNGVVYDYIDPFNIIPDPDDLSPQYTDMKFVCRKIWMSPDMIKNKWPKTTSEVDFGDPDLIDYGAMFSPEIIDRNTTYTDSNVFTGLNQNRMLVVEVQYKVPHKYFCGIDKNGHYFETFDFDTAEELVESKKQIEQKNGTRIMRTVFMANILLEHAPLDSSLPNQKDFSYIPIVHQRQHSTGICYGIIQTLKDIQRECNVRLTKGIYAINSARIVFEGQPMEGITIDMLKQELKSADSVIMLPKDSKFNLSSNDNMGEANLKTIDMYMNLMQRATGIHNEMLGIQTNATSGVAQKIRQVNSVRNNVFAFDNFAQMKKRESKFILDMIQVGAMTNIIVEVLTDEEREVMILNLVRDVNGKKVVFNDIRTLPLSLYIEEVPDYQSSFEEQKTTFEALLSNPNAGMLLNSPELLRRMGVKNPEKIAEEMQKAMQDKAMQELKIRQMQQQGQQLQQQPQLQQMAAQQQAA